MDVDFPVSRNAVKLGNFSVFEIFVDLKGFFKKSISKCTPFFDFFVSACHESMMD